MNFLEQIHLPENIQKPLRVAVKYLPAGLFALYSLLLFFFYLASVAQIPYGTGWVNLGNVYGFLSEPIYGGIRSSMGALIAFAVIGLICAIAGLALLETPFYDLSKLNENIVKLLRFVWKFVPCLFYFLFFIVACVIFGQVADLNQQFGGMIAAGACPTLILIFTILFALVHTASLLCEFYVLKEEPQVADDEIIEE